MSAPDNGYGYWTAIEEKGLPPVTASDPYPTCFVILKCVGKTWRTIHVGELRFFGGDRARPYWKSGESKGGILENDSWYVTHWARPELPGAAKPLSTEAEIA